MTHGDTPVVRAVIVEDEPYARQSLRDFLADVDWIELVGEAASGREAVRLLEEARPDLVFLDVQMPELTGLEVLERIDFEPAVVFTTAFDDYAIRAFELGAIDYLLKPFARERFHRMLARVRPALSAAAPGVRVVERAREAALEPLARLFVRHGERIVPVAVGEISRLDAGDDYTTVVAGAKSYLVALTLNEIGTRLPPERFLRVHRSHIVNLDFVVAFEPYDRRLMIRMRDGTTVLASRAASQTLKGLAR